MAKEKQQFHPFGDDPDKILDKIEKNIGLSDGTINPNEKRMPTGVLCLDLFLCGGIAAGLYTNLGKEQCCKTTTEIEVLMNSLLYDVPFRYHFDFEGSTGSAPQYVENIARKKGLKYKVEEIFGQKDDKGNYINRPLIRYRDETVAERFFDLVAQIERRIPDKRLMNDKWWYIYDPEEIKNAKEIVGNNYDEKYFKSTGKYRIEAPDGSLQAVIGVDSYPAMLPESLDVDEPGAGMAAQARMFSSELKRIKGRLKGKRIAIIGVNTLRLKPGPSFGNPEYEPCGEALKQFSDVRIKFTSRSLSGLDSELEVAKGKGALEQEKSLSGDGQDNYRYIHLSCIKNKLSQPISETWIRLWAADENGEAHGLDPVFDTWWYLKLTGQLKGSKRAITLGIVRPNGGRLVAKKNIDWHEFKQLILGDKEKIKEICEKLGFEKPLRLRDWCQRQIESGKGTELFFECKKRKLKAPKKVESEGSADDDD